MCNRHRTVSCGTNPLCVYSLEIHAPLYLARAAHSFTFSWITCLELPVHLFPIMLGLSQPQSMGHCHDKFGGQGVCACRWEWLESGAGAPVLVAASLPPNKTGPWVRFFTSSKNNGCLLSEPCLPCSLSILPAAFCCKLHGRSCMH